MCSSDLGLSQGDTYEALRKGVVQGTLCPIETLCGWKQGEVIKAVTRIPSLGYTTSMFVVMNKKTWNRLPEEIQKIIRDINQEWIAKHGKLWDDMDAEGEAFVRKLGREIISLPPEEDAKAAAALKPLLDGWAEGAEKKGLPGKEAVAFLHEQIATAQQAAKNKEN